MDFRYDYHKSFGVEHVGCEKPRAYFIPYHSPEAALAGIRGESERFCDLCGEWQFAFYNNVREVDIDPAGEDLAGVSRKRDRPSAVYQHKLSLSARPALHTRGEPLRALSQDVYAWRGARRP